MSRHGAPLGKDCSVYASGQVILIETRTRVSGQRRLSSVLDERRLCGSSKPAGLQTGRQTPVDTKVDPRDVAGKRARQKSYCVGNLL